MDPSVPLARGAAELNRLLDERTLDLRTLGVGGFRRWLERHLARWARDPVFVQRTAIREIRRAHPRLRDLEAELRAAEAADRASPLGERLRRTGRDLVGADRAVAGLGGALDGAAPEKRSAIQHKLDGFRARRAGLERELDELVRASGERRALLRLGAELAALRAETGLDAQEARLRELLRDRGRGSGRGGAAFEDLAAELTRRHVVPELEGSGPQEGGEVRVLRGVTLGAARMELDQLLVRPALVPGEPVEVLALVEVKRGINDLAHGFRMRQENLAWLTGDEAGYDPAAYRTRSFPTGRFDRAAAHRAGGEVHALGPGSFRRFRRDPATGLFLDGLYLVTRDGPVWGLGSAALARVAHRVATDEGWDPASEAYLAGLLEWCRPLACAVETPDVLRTYAATEARARQVLVVGAKS
ncbi:MAG TPA: hypothetical protein VGV85_14440 [Longimicrobiaceae bacterium]|nr:hypothetical protein [Longimicrobiaceae bacterium]